MAVSDEPKKAAVSVTVSYAEALAWLKANWPRFWEKGAYAIIVLAAASLRLWHLGARSLNHDESLHATYSWYLYNGDGYTHDPMMHGPFQFFMNAFTWKFLSFLSSAPILNSFADWGPSDYTARLSYALFGTALVLLPFLLRGYIGRTGALFAALFIAFSPVIVYFNRFARGDTYMAFWTLAIVVCMWRYWAEKRPLYLYLTAGFLALSFATKEVTFLISGLFLIYLDLLVAWELTGQLQERWQGNTATPEETPDPAPSPRKKKREKASSTANPEAGIVRWAITFVCLVPIAWLIAITWPATEKLRRGWKMDQWPLSADLLIIVGTLAGVQFAAAVQMLPFVHDKGFYKDPGVNEDTLMKMSVFVFLTISAYIGLLWRPKTWLIAAGIFYAIFVLLFTSFFTNMSGFWSGIWGSFDYWLQQQGVERGSQPVYYYLMLLPMYDFLPLILAMAGAVWLLLRRQLLASLLAVLAVCALVFAYFTIHVSLLGMVPVLVVLGVVLFVLKQDLFTSFLVFWAAGSMIAFATAGEKMPWLTMHMTVPLIILAARSLNSLYEKFRISLPLSSRSPETLVLLAAVAGGLSIIVLWVTAFSSAGAVVALILGVAAAGLIARAFTLHGKLLGTQAAAALLIPALFVFTVRDTIRANFDLGNWPREILSYADTSPGIPWARDELVALGNSSGLGRDYPIVVDNEVAWPMVWYLRDYKPQWAGTEMPAPIAGSLVVLKSGHESWMDPYLDQYEPPVSTRHLWWFGDGPQFYEGITSVDFAQSLFNKNDWNVWRNYFVWRSVPWAPPPNDMLVYIPKQLATAELIQLKAPEPIPTVTIPPQNQTVIGEGQLNAPTDVTVDTAGNIYVSDSKNNRVQVFDSAGKLLRTLQPSGDEAFAEPWSVGLGPDGSVYVSDTWHYENSGRVAKYNADLEPAATPVWATAKELGLYGPRDVLPLPDGSVLVADTGNKRIVKLSPYGDLVTAFGSEGSGPGQFSEPVGLALGPNGDIYVADTWNGRVQHFDSNSNYIGEFPVNGWGSTDVNAKPFLVVLPDGRVIVSSPANGRVELYDLQGKAIAAWELPEASAGVKGRPVGLALDSQGFLYVADISGNRVYRLPVAGLTGP